MIRFTLSNVSSHSFKTKLMFTIDLHCIGLQILQGKNIMTYSNIQYSCNNVVAIQMIELLKVIISIGIL